MRQGVIGLGLVLMVATGGGGALLWYGVPGLQPPAPAPLVFDEVLPRADVRLLCTLPKPTPPPDPVPDTEH